MPNLNFSTCCTCGTQWQTGTDGSHSCTKKLLRDKMNLEIELACVYRDLESCHARCDIATGEGQIMKAALYKVHSHIFDIQDGHAISDSDGEIIDIVNTALEETP